MFCIGKSLLLVNGLSFTCRLLCRYSMTCIIVSMEHGDLMKSLQTSITVSNLALI